MRIALAVLCVLFLVSDVSAQRRRHRNQVQWSNATVQGSSSSLEVTGPGKMVDGQTTGKPYTGTAQGSKDAMDEVNAYRIARGLTPFRNDPLLNQAAQAAAKYRAERLIEGHVSGGGGDFQFLPSGANCNTAGCGALEPSWGWGTCCMDGNYTYAGAAWVMGSNGKRFMHLFVR